jgi:hypothetical protein
MIFKIMPHLRVSDIATSPLGLKGYNPVTSLEARMRYFQVVVRSSVQLLDLKVIIHEVSGLQDNVV